MQKRMIHSATTLAGIYTSKSGKIIKAYIEQKVMPQWAANTKNVDDAGAKVARVVSPGHSGGTDPNEDFHICVKVEDEKGRFLKSPKGTDVWNVYPPGATNAKELKKIAVAWDKEGRK
ncbi:hypothetical protein Agabi119p4_10736 [Agaricus bisporus var. burnettii]|uniref:Uncharacterized protein n=1 Tax=Agaricus bisporus var. burnettii TaxID=192524 RepID=A0A8H7C2K4_AGABI|nr:hypothetical protein Agabi119p4_10736 [Agaricus bisporus var. burnettii]